MRLACLGPVRILKARAWPYIVASALIFIVGQVVLDGAIGGLVSFVGLLCLVGTSLLRLRGTKHAVEDGVEGMDRVTRAGGIGGGGVG